VAPPVGELACGGDQDLIRRGEASSLGGVVAPHPDGHHDGVCLPAFIEGDRRGAALPRTAAVGTCRTLSALATTTDTLADSRLDEGVRLSRAWSRCR